MDILNEFSSMGIKVNIPVIVLTIIATNYILRFVKTKTDNAELHIGTPFIVGVILYSLWVYKDGSMLSAKHAFDGILNTLAAIGAYTPVSSWLAKRGFLQ